jgi:GTPase SAR1 family protein
MNSINGTRFRRSMRSSRGATRSSRALCGLTDVAASLGTKTLRERVDRDLVRKLDEDRFHLVVVGEFNHGKTTFVNALLGERACHGRDADDRGHPPHSLGGAARGIRRLPRASASRSRSRREALSPSAAARRRGGRLPRDRLPRAAAQERILLVDTPGVNDLSLQRADITYSYIPRADAVLFLLDAGQILKESERVFLNDKLLKGSRDKIVFVITKWDLLSPDEQRRRSPTRRTSSRRS